MHSYNGCEPSAHYYRANCESVFYRKKTYLQPLYPQEWRIVSDVLCSCSKCSESESICYHIQGDHHLINLLWKYAGGGWHNMIPFLFQTLVWLAYLILIMVHNLPSFLNWTRFYPWKCNSLTVPIFMLFTWFWPFLFNTKFVSQTNSFEVCWLKLR